MAQTYFLFFTMTSKIHPNQTNDNFFKIHFKCYPYTAMF